MKILPEFIFFPVEEMWMFRYHFQEQIAEVIKVILQERASE